MNILTKELRYSISKTNDKLRRQWKEEKKRSFVIFLVPIDLNVNE